jgi:outer membrane protein assembly factor BamB
MKARCWLAWGLSSLVAAAALGDDFTLSKYDSGRSGYTKEKLSPPLSLTWKFTVAEDKQASSLPLVVGNRVYWCTGGWVYGLDIETGAPVWSEPFRTQWQIRMTPVYYDGKLFVGNEGGELFVLDAADAPPQRLIKQFGKLGTTLTYDPVVVGSTMYLISNRGGLYTLNLKTLDDQAFQHIFEFGTGLHGPVAFGGDDFLSFLTLDDKVCCYQISRNRVLWQKTIGVGAVPPMFANGGLIVGDDQETSCLRIKTSTSQWTKPYPAFRSSASASADRLYVASQSAVFALDLHTGKILAAIQLDGLAFDSPIVADQDVYVGTALGNIYCLDAATLARKWYYRCSPLETIGDKPKVFGVNAPLVVADGCLFAINQQGTLFCFRSDSPDVGKPQILQPAFLTTYTDGKEHGPLAVDDETRQRKIDDAKEAVKNTVPPQEPKIPDDAKPWKVPGHQKHFYFGCYLFDEGSGINFDGINIKLNGQRMDPSRIPKGIPNCADYYLLVDLLGPSVGAVLPTLKDGLYTITLTVPDFKGNVMVKSYTVEIDNNQPQPVYQAPATPGVPGGPGGPGGPGMPGMPGGPGGPGMPGGPMAAP